MPAEVFGPEFAFLPRAELLTFEEIAVVARELVALGARTLRITGGEPLVRRDLERLVALLRALDASEELCGELLDLALTTNGSLLAKLAAPLRAAGLNRITVSLDSLTPETFTRMSGSALPLESVLEGIAAAANAGFTRIKLNAVIRRGVNEAEIPALVEFARANGHTLRMIEYMDVGTTNGWRLDEVLPASEIVARIHALHPIEPIAPSRPGEVANRYRYLDGGGEIGLIASVSAPFCGDCTRARVSADGAIRSCAMRRRRVVCRRWRCSASAADCSARRVFHNRDLSLRSSWRSPRNSRVSWWITPFTRTCVTGMLSVARRGQR